MRLLVRIGGRDEDSGHALIGQMSLGQCLCCTDQQQSSPNRDVGIDGSWEALQLNEVTRAVGRQAVLPVAREDSTQGKPRATPASGWGETFSLQIQSSHSYSGTPGIPCALIMPLLASCLLMPDCSEQVTWPEHTLLSSRESRSVIHQRPLL